MRFLLAMLVLLAFAASAAEPELLEPDKAFRFSARMLDAHSVELRYEIAPGYYLYRDKFRFTADPQSADLGSPAMPAGKVKKDNFFGDVEIYRGDLRIVLPLGNAGGLQFKLKAVSQGCADVGVCYAPQDATVTVNPATLSAIVPGSDLAMFLNRGPQPPPASGQAEDTRIAQLFGGSFWLLIATFFGYGLLLAFTPCVFPMIPILSGVLAPHGARLTSSRGFGLSVAYVFGMAITYSLAGIAAGMAGTLLSVALQNPWVLGAFALIFVFLALSMLGVYELQMPGALQTRLSQASGQLHGGHFASVFGMGVLSALIVGPCVAAPLAGALLYISQSHDPLLGGAALFVMALGMGTPLLALGASTGALLPKAGPWMENVKRAFGVMLLGVAIYMVSPVIPSAVHFLLWAALLVFAAVLLGLFRRSRQPASAFQRLAKGAGVAALLVATALVAGALSGGRDLLHPLAGLRMDAAHAPAAPAFRRVASVAELDAALAASDGKPAMLDFYADWCVSCKEMERDTFSSPAVQARFAQITLLRADVTANNADDQALLKRFNLFGPPGIVFFDKTGAEVRSARVVGFEAPDRFGAVVDGVLR
jgi:thioredoxin:protein disulfide reductase